MGKKLFGVSYNVFDGLELLEHSIGSIREYVDHINVVYQKISNTGIETTEPVEDIINALVTSKLVDEVYCYNPKLKRSLHENECEKRKLGSYISANAGCHYHMSMDCDELYIGEQFSAMKEDYIKEGLVAGYSQMQTYYKTTEYVLEPPEDYYVSLFYDITGGNTYQFLAPCEVLVDPTRRMAVNGNTKVFARNEIEMHHLSYIRKNIRLKLETSSASTNFKQDIDKIVEHYEQFDYKIDPRAYWGGAPSKYYNLKKIEDKFGIGF